MHHFEHSKRTMIQVLFLVPALPTQMPQRLSLHLLLLVRRLQGQHQYPPYRVTLVVALLAFELKLVQPNLES